MCNELFLICLFKFSSITLSRVIKLCSLSLHFWVFSSLTFGSPTIVILSFLEVGHPYMEQFAPGIVIYKRERSTLFLQWFPTFFRHFETLLCPSRGLGTSNIELKDIKQCAIVRFPTSVCIFWLWYVWALCDFVIFLTTLLKSKIVGFLSRKVGL